MECLEGGNGGTKRIQEAVRALTGVEARVTEVMVVAVF
jgi:hypothetical protein